MKNWFKVFLIYFIFGLLVYCNSLNNKFLIDDFAFKSNPVMSESKYVLSQWNPYREPQLGDYRPLAYSLYDISYGTFKNNFRAYHLLNLFLLALVSTLIFLCIEKITGNYDLALLSGLLYLIHPINGIMVNYITANAFAFQAICILAAVLLLLGSLERDNDRTLYFFSLFFSILSLFWHESGIMTPFYISAVVLLFGKGPLKTKMIYLCPYYLISFLYILFRFYFSVGGNVLLRTALFHVTGGQYLAAMFKVYAWYISKLFYPQGIVMQWSTPIAANHIILNILGLCSLAVIFGSLYVKFTKIKILQLALVWALIGFVPVLAAAMLRSYTCAVIEPHWFVFSSIGFFIIAAHAALSVLDRSKRIGAVLLFILILSWGSISFAYNQLWVDQKTYALYWSQQSPYTRSTYSYLAYAYQSEGDLINSRKYYRRALTGK